MSFVLAIQAVLAAMATSLAAMWFKQWRGDAQREYPKLVHVATGFITNFFDTLGIGSYATTTAFLRFRKMIRDDLIPGTLNLGHAIPSITQGLIFIALIKVDIKLLLSCIVASIIGAAFGVPIVARFHINTIRLFMGAALLIFASILTLNLLEFMPAGGAALTLPPGPFAVAVFACMIFGALMTVGIGNYAPTLITLSLLGLDPKAAFPIMMTAGSLVASAAGMQFLRVKRFSMPIALGLTLGGVFGVLIAAYIVRSLPLDVLKWLVVVIAVYAGISLLKTALTDKTS
jgi:uncharacterized membrane protein YfcA